ncbi:MAG: 50S ribosomal protein L3, partial [Lentisphaerae bacterium]|nr:50S ribosomal protein L3 [Lentisphaerota bacterium]
MQGLIGKKLGMTRVFDAQGAQLPVTVIECGPCLVIQCKTKAVDGYDAVQVGFGEKKEHRTNKPDLGRFKKAGVTPKRSLCEFALDEGETLKAGDSVAASIFEGIPYVDVSGVTKGKGFQ